MRTSYLEKLAHQSLLQVRMKLNKFNGYLYLDAYLAANTLTC